MKTVNLMFDGELQECLVQESGGEILCYARDGQFVKFPIDVDLKSAVKAHNEANADKPITADAVQADADDLAAWLGGK